MAFPELAQLSFTPSADGVVHVVATFLIGGMSSGGYVGCQIYVEQSGTRVWGASEGIPADAGYQTNRSVIQGRFPVSAGVPVLVGMYGTVSGPAAGSWSDIELNVSLHKRGA